MKYIIYGVNRVAKDFLYIFSHLDILYLMDETAALNRLWGYEIKGMEEALQDRSYDRIILCDFEKKQKEHVLKKRGLQYGVDFITTLKF